MLLKKIMLTAIVVFSVQAENITGVNQIGSQSKYQRIGNIEKYLTSLQSSLSEMQSSLQEDYQSRDKSLEKKMKTLSKEMKTSVDELKKELEGLNEKMESFRPLEPGPSTSGNEDEGMTLEQKVEIHNNRLDTIEVKLTSIDGTLKSIMEMLTTKDNP